MWDETYLFPDFKGAGMATHFWVCHYTDVIMTTIASQITSPTVVYSIVYSDQIKENIKAPRHWPLCGEFTGDRWILRTNGQLRGKCFHLMTSSWLYFLNQNDIFIYNGATYGYTSHRKFHSSNNQITETYNFSRNIPGSIWQVFKNSTWQWGYTRDI